MLPLPNHFRAPIAYASNARSRQLGQRTAAQDRQDDAIVTGPTGATIADSGRVRGAKRRREGPGSALEELDDLLFRQIGALGPLGPLVREEERGDNGYSGGNSSGADAPGIAARLDRLNALMERLSRTDSVRALKGEMEKEKEREKEHEREERYEEGNERPDASAPDDFPVPAAHELDLVDPVGSMNLGHLSLDDGGQSRLVFLSEGIQALLTRQICWYYILGVYIGRDQRAQPAPTRPISIP